jgi:hypothetical protein
VTRPTILASHKDRPVGAETPRVRAPGGQSDASPAHEPRPTLMARPAAGTVVRRPTKRGTSYLLKVTWTDPATGVTDRYHEKLGGEWEGWTEERVQEERELIAKLIARGEWMPSSRREPATRTTTAAAPTAEAFEVAATRHYDRRQRRMESDKSRADLRWRLSVAIAYLGERSVDAITTGDIDSMVDGLLRERDEIRKAREVGAPLMEDYVDARTGRTHQRRRRGPANSSINKVVRAVRAVLDDAVRNRVVDRNEAAAPDVLVREPRPSRSFLEPFQIVALHEAGAMLEREAGGLTWDDVHAIRASSAPAVALARAYHVSDTLIGKVRRRSCGPPRRRAAATTCPARSSSSPSPCRAAHQRAVRPGRRGPRLRRAQDLRAAHAPHRRRPTRPRQGDQDRGGRARAADAARRPRAAARPQGRLRPRA